jgi:hypothetical protein
VEDLLAARALLELSEDQQEPAREAATRFAARTCGETRRTELADLALAYVRQLDARVRDLREAAVVWSAAKMSEAVNSEE